MLLSSIILFSSCSSETKSDFVYKSIDENTCEITGLRQDSTYKNSEEIEIPKYISENKKVISVSGFSENQTIKKIILPKCLSTIKKEAFSSSTSLKNVYFYKNCNLKTIEDNAFYGCKSLKGMRFPTSLETIGKNAFYGCTTITSLTIPDSLISLGENSFTGCTNLENLTIGTGIDKMIDCFDNIDWLESIEIPGNVKTFKDFSNCPRLESIGLAEGVEEILSGAMSSNKSLRYVYIPKSVKTFETGVFEGCSKDLTIYCGATHKPSTWSKQWNENGYEVHWAE